MFFSSASSKSVHFFNFSRLSSTSRNPSLSSNLPPMSHQGLEPSKQLPRVGSDDSKSKSETDGQLNSTRTNSETASPPPTSKELDSTAPIEINPEEEPEISKWSTLPEWKVGGKKLQGRSLNFGIVSHLLCS